LNYDLEEIDLQYYQKFSFIDIWLLMFKRCKFFLEKDKRYDIFVLKLSELENLEFNELLLFHALHKFLNKSNSVMFNKSLKILMHNLKPPKKGKDIKELNAFEQMLVLVNFNQKDYEEKEKENNNKNDENKGEEILKTTTYNTNNQNINEKISEKIDESRIVDEENEKNKNKNKENEKESRLVNQLIKVEELKPKIIKPWDKEKTIIIKNLYNYEDYFLKRRKALFKRVYKLYFYFYYTLKMDRAMSVSEYMLDLRINLLSNIDIATKNTSSDLKKVIYPILLPKKGYENYFPYIQESIYDMYLEIFNPKSTQKLILNKKFISNIHYIHDDERIYLLANCENLNINNAYKMYNELIHDYVKWGEIDDYDDTLFDLKKKMFDNKNMNLNYDKEYPLMYNYNKFFQNFDFNIYTLYKDRNKDLWFEKKEKNLLKCFLLKYKFCRNIFIIVCTLAEEFNLKYLSFLKKVCKKIQFDKITQLKIYEFYKDYITNIFLVTSNQNEAVFKIFMDNLENIDFYYKIKIITKNPQKYNPYFLKKSTTKLIKNEELKESEKSKTKTISLIDSSNKINEGSVKKTTIEKNKRINDSILYTKCVKVIEKYTHFDCLPFDNFNNLQIAKNHIIKNNDLYYRTDLQIYQYIYYLLPMVLFKKNNKGEDLINIYYFLQLYNLFELSKELWFWVSHYQTGVFIHHTTHYWKNKNNICFNQLIINKYSFLNKTLKFVFDVDYNGITIRKYGDFYSICKKNKKTNYNYNLEDIKSTGIILVNNIDDFLHKYLLLDNFQNSNIGYKIIKFF